MNVIFMSSHLNRIALKILINSTKVVKQIGFYPFID